MTFRGQMYLKKFEKKYSETSIKKKSVPCVTHSCLGGVI